MGDNCQKSAPISVRGKLTCGYLLFNPVRVLVGPVEPEVDTRLQNIVLYELLLSAEGNVPRFSSLECFVEGEGRVSREMKCVSRDQKLLSVHHGASFLLIWHAHFEF